MVCCCFYCCYFNATILLLLFWLLFCFCCRICVVGVVILLMFRVHFYREYKYVLNKLFVGKTTELHISSNLWITTPSVPSSPVNDESLLLYQASRRFPWLGGATRTHRHWRQYLTQQFQQNRASFSRVTHSYTPTTKNHDSKSTRMNLTTVRHNPLPWALKVLANKGCLWKHSSGRRKEGGAIDSCQHREHANRSLYELRVFDAQFLSVFKQSVQFLASDLFLLNSHSHRKESNESRHWREVISWRFWIIFDVGSTTEECVY